MVCASCGFDSPPAFRFCGQCGDALDAPREQRRTVTILFADLVGFKELASTLDPERVHDIADEYFQTVREIVERYQGIIDKYIGDAVMAVFGAPTAHGDDPARAVRSALEIRSALEEFLVRASREANGDIGLRVGINTGRVVWGGVGKGAVSGNVTVVGDAVNVASRLESHAPVGGILLGESTWKHVRQSFRCDALDPIRVKGKSEPLRAFLAEAELPHSTRATAAGEPAPFVGRLEELESLRDLIRFEDEAASARLVTVKGPAGIGKSRLVTRFRRDAEEEGLGVLVARPSTFGTGGIWAPWESMLARCAHLLRDAEAGVRRAQLSDWLSKVAGRESVELAPLVEYLAGVSDPASAELATLRRDAGRLTVSLGDAVRRMLEAMGRGRPWLLCAEDVHLWSDPARHLLRVAREARAPVAIVATAADDVLDGWPPADAQATIELGPFNPDEVAVLVAGHLGMQLPESWSRQIAELSGGNPLFVEEILSTLVEQEVLEAGSNEWIVHEDAWARIQLPATVESLLQARFDRLTRDQQRVLQRASVVGNAFWRKTLTEGMGESGVEPILMGLVARDFVRVRKRSRLEQQQEYVFKSPLMREVVYETVLLRERQEAHRQVAGWLERVAGDSVEGFSAELAEHYLEAGDEAQALPYLVSSADRALEAGAASRALVHLDRAVDLVARAPDDVLRLRIYALRGRARRVSGDSTGALKDLKAARGVAEQLSDFEEVARINVDIAGALYQQGELRAVEEHARMALQAAQRAGASRLEAVALNLLGVAAANRGQHEDAVRWYREALEVDAREGNEAGVGVRLGNIANVYLRSGALDKAIETLEAALDKPLGKESEGIARSNLGLALLMKGNGADAVRALEKALAVARVCGSALIETEVRARLGCARALTGDERGVEQIQSARRSAEESGFAEQHAETWWLEGLAKARAREVEAARTAFERCRDEASRLDNETLLSRAQQGLDSLLD